MEFTTGVTKEFPTEVTINGFIYNIILKDQEDMGDDYGSINFDQCVISIRNDIDEQNQWQTLLHEIEHGIVNHYDNNKYKEDHIERRSQGRYNLWVDNLELLWMFINNHVDDGVDVRTLS